MRRKKYPGQLVFGLDIGTRSIVGTVGYRMDDGKFVVVAQCGKEHETRAMLDGQIHDIAKVGETILDVKKRLEKKLSRKLEKVCIAAAGRVLKTIQIHSDMEFGMDHVVTQEDVHALNSKATEDAYKEFLKTADSDVRFYCVGSSVVRYYLNDYSITNLQDHKAKKIGVDMIATFLPDDVVDGLYKAVELAGLGVASMTLEPIAAIELAIPEKFRLLNIALVDVGAGTSDISITKEGTITAFGMIPIAGDSLTEPIAMHCMVDFNTAEQIKRDATEQDVVTYEDIMGLPMQITREQVEELLRPSVERMTEEVAQKILSLNGDKSVGAVFVVGGGGKIPGYTASLAAKLNLAPERVALRGKEVMQNIIFEDTEMEQNSLLVTPIGICLDFYKENHNFIYVNFNDTTVKLYNTDKLTIMDAAMQAEFPSAGLFPKSGKKLSFTVNGKSRFARGEMGDAAEITLNGEAANLYSPIKDNDIIKVKESTAGAKGKMLLEKLPEYKTEIAVFVNGNKVMLPKYPTVNGELVTGSYKIKEGDSIEFLDYVTIEQIQTAMDIPADMAGTFVVNNKEAQADTRVYENFEVVWKMAAQSSEKEEDYVSSYEEDYEDEDSVDAVETVVQEETGPTAEQANGQQTTMGAQPAARMQTMTGTQTTVTQSAGATAQTTATQTGVAESPVQEAPKPAAPARILHVMANGRPIAMTGKASYVFVDVFDYIAFDRTKPQGAIVCTINGREAGYMEELHEGDIVEVYWRKI